MQAASLSPEKCIVVVRRITLGKTEGKADGLHALEGSSPGGARASIQDTTGV